MAILPGFIRTKKYRRLGNDYKPQSEWTSSTTVEMGDGNTAETNLGAIKGITSSLASTSTNYAMSAYSGKALQDQITLVNTNLQNHNHDGVYAKTSETNVHINGINARLTTALRYIGVYQQQITLNGNGEFFQAIPSQYQNEGYFYYINCSGNSLHFLANMEKFNMAVKNTSINTLSTTVQVYVFSVGV